jgi:hypothetical protein
MSDFSSALFWQQRKCLPDCSRSSQEVGTVERRIDAHAEFGTISELLLDAVVR